MSLVCYECQVDIQPSKRLPGREGSLVHPSLLSLVYVPSDDKISDALRYLESDANRSVCLGCIEKGLPSERKEKVLSQIYDCYEAETAYKREMKKEKGKFISFADMKSIGAFEIFDKKYKALKAECVFCDSKADDGNPFFTARLLDRVYSSEHLSLFGSYSFSNLKRGSTYFNICFGDFRKNMPKSFEQISYDLLRENNPNFNIGKSVLYISASAKEAIERETGKSLDNILGDKEIVIH